MNHDSSVYTGERASVMDTFLAAVWRDWFPRVSLHSWQKPVISGHCSPPLFCCTRWTTTISGAQEHFTSLVYFHTTGWIDEILWTPRVYISPFALDRRALRNSTESSSSLFNGSRVPSILVKQRDATQLTHNRAWTASWTWDTAKGNACVISHTPLFPQSF